MLGVGASSFREYVFVCCMPALECVVGIVDDMIQNGLHVSYVRCFRFDISYVVVVEQPLA